MRDRNLHTPPPLNSDYKEVLRYLVQSSDPNAGELPFLVSLWHHAIEKGGLTPAQVSAVQPFIDEGSQFLNTWVFPPKLEELDLTNVVQFDQHRGK